MADPRTEGQSLLTPLEQQQKEGDLESPFSGGNDKIKSGRDMSELQRRLRGRDNTGSGNVTKR